MPETQPIQVKVVNRGGVFTDVFDAVTGRPIHCHRIEIVQEAGELPRIAIITNFVELDITGIGEAYTRVVREG